MEISSSEKRKLEHMMKVASSMSISLTPHTKKQLEESILKHMKLQTQIPDHPPYSFMIRRAVEELNQTKGSSKEAISKFIVENYQHIPFAHEVLLSNHLQKLRDRGEIVITNDVNYAFEQGDSTL